MIHKIKGSIEPNIIEWHLEAGGNGGVRIYANNKGIIDVTDDGTLYILKDSLLHFKVTIVEC